MLCRCSMLSGFVVNFQALCNTNGIGVKDLAQIFAPFGAVVKLKM
jgi:hypothetical protein